MVSISVTVLMWTCTLLQVINYIVLMFVVINFFYRIQVILRAFWILTKNQINGKINRIQRFYQKVFMRQLLSPKKKVVRLLDQTSDPQTEQNNRKESVSTRYTAAARNSAYSRRVSSTRVEIPDQELINLPKAYKRKINEIPQRRLFSSTALKLTLKFSWRIVVIIVLNLLGNFFLFDKSGTISLLIGFHKNFIEMATSTVNMNSMAFHNFAPFSNTTHINEQYVKSRYVAVRNFYNFLGHLKDSTIVSFFDGAGGVDRISNDIDVLQLKNFNVPPSSKRHSLFYLHEDHSNAQLIRSSLTPEIISAIQEEVSHVTRLGFKTVFQTHVNFNDYLLIYYGKLPQSQDSFERIENSLHQLLLSNMNMFDHVMQVHAQAFDSYKREFYMAEIAFALLFVVVFVWLMKHQLRIYNESIPKDFFYFRNILNLFHILEFGENKILEKFFIEEIMPSLKQ